MKKTRVEVFETNSSSTHSLSYCKNVDLKEYIPVGDKIIIDFINTDMDGVFVTLKEKVSYLVSHIINNYKYYCLDLEAFALNLAINSCNSLIFSSFFLLASFACFKANWLDSYQKS